MALLLNAVSQPVANLPTGTEESAVTIRTLSHTLYALLATLTTGRSLRLVQRVPNRKWVRRVETDGGRERAEPGMSDNPATFEETWKSWEHQVDIYENLSSTKLDDDVKISVVLRECPQKLRDHLLVNSQQFESNYNKLGAIIEAYLNTNKTWIVNDFRCDGRGLDRQEQKQRQKQQQEQRQEQRQKRQQRQGQEQRKKVRIATKAKAKARTTAKAKAVENLTMTKSATCAKRVISHETVGHEQITTRW